MMKTGYNRTNAISQTRRNAVRHEISVARISIRVTGILNKHKSLRDDMVNGWRIAGLGLG